MAASRSTEVSHAPPASGRTDKSQKGDTWFSGDSFLFFLYSVSPIGFRKSRSAEHRYPVEVSLAEPQDTKDDPVNLKWAEPKKQQRVSQHTSVRRSQKKQQEMPHTSSDGRSQKNTQMILRKPQIGGACTKTKDGPSNLSSIFLCMGIEAVSSFLTSRRN